MLPASKVNRVARFPGGFRSEVAQGAAQPTGAMDDSAQPRRTLTARAYALGERIEVRDIQGDRSAIGAVLVPVHGGWAIVYRFGCVVLFDVCDEDTQAFLRQLAPQLSAGFDELVVDQAQFAIGANGTTSFFNQGVVLGDHSATTLHVLGDVLAKSVALEHHERHIAATSDQLEPLTTALARTGKTGSSAKILVRHIAASLLAEHHLIGRIEIVEKPDLLWDQPQLERLHAWLVRDYEIKERQVALERKLHLLSRTAQVLLDLLQTRRSLRVEWYIVVLIVVEVGLMLAFEWR